MRGGKFLTHTLPDFDARMSLASNDEELSDVCRNIEARLKVEGADMDQWMAYEDVREQHVKRVYAGARAG